MSGDEKMGDEMGDFTNRISFFREDITIDRDITDGSTPRTEEVSGVRRGSLPESVRPLRYDIHLVPDVARSKFSGYVSAYIQVLRDTDSVTLHCLELQV